MIIGSPGKTIKMPRRAAQRRSCSPMVLHHFASHMTPSEYVIANSMTSGSSWLTLAGKRLRSMEFECLLQSKLSSGGTGRSWPIAAVLEGSARPKAVVCGIHSRVAAGRIEQVKCPCGLVDHGYGACSQSLGLVRTRTKIPRMVPIGTAKSSKKPRVRESERPHA